MPCRWRCGIVGAGNVAFLSASLKVIVPLACKSYALNICFVGFLSLFGSGDKARIINYLKECSPKVTKTGSNLVQIVSLHEKFVF